MHGLRILVRNKLIQCVVPENIHNSPMEGYWEFQRGEGREVQISKGFGGEKSSIFPEGPRALSEGNLS